MILRHPQVVGRAGLIERPRAQHGHGGSLRIPQFIARLQILRMEALTVYYMRPFFCVIASHLEAS